MDVLEFLAAWYLEFLTFCNPKFGQILSINDRKCARISNQCCCYKNIANRCFGFDYKFLNYGVEYKQENVS